MFKMNERTVPFKRFMTTMSTVSCAVLMVSANADLAPYSQNFEGLDPLNTAALTDDAWLVFGNVFDPSGTVFLYDYGAFPAPNDGGGFSGVTSGEGGVEQGANQLVIFNDYNNADHNSGFLIESNVFQQQTIGAADVGKTYTFSYDAKRGNIEGASTAQAFVKTLDPDAGFATTNFETLDTTNLATTWNSFEIPLTIDEGLIGQIIQYGYSTTTTSFIPSGNFYDNITFNDGVVDSDGDGVDDSADNCTLASNPDQIDTNGDGIGNRCDADVNNDCDVNFGDIVLFANAFNTEVGDVNYDEDLDINSSGAVNFPDYITFTGQFGGPPGPSANDCVPM